MITHREGINEAKNENKNLQRKRANTLTTSPSFLLHSASRIVTLDEQIQRLRSSNDQLMQTLTNPSISHQMENHSHTLENLSHLTQNPQLTENLNNNPSLLQDLRMFPSNAQNSTEFKLSRNEKKESTFSRFETPLISPTIESVAAEVSQLRVHMKVILERVRWLESERQRLTAENRSLTAQLARLQHNHLPHSSSPSRPTGKELLPPPKQNLVTQSQSFGQNSQTQTKTVKIPESVRFLTFFSTKLSQQTA